MISIRRNWRVIALVVLVLGSATALFVPGVGAGGDDGPTNLQYGLDLSGGTRLRAPLVGTTAEEVDLQGHDPDAVAEAVAAELDGVTRSDVRVRPGGRTVEVFAGDVTAGEFAAALEAAGLDVSTDAIRDGVAEPTRETAVAVIERKIDASGLAGGTVQQSSTPAGEHFIVIEIPNRDPESVRELVSQRGVIEIVARFPARENGSAVVRKETVLTQRDIDTVGTVQERSSTPGGINNPYVPVTLTEEGAAKFARAMEQYGFTSERGTDSCGIDPYTGDEIPPEEEYCIDTVLDGERVYNASLASSLAEGIRSGDFERSGDFVITANTRDEARELWLNLRAGALPASLDLEAGTTTFISAGLAENFKLYSLITGVVAVLAVAVVVFLRYGDPTVAAPMVVTALSEVAILLGVFAASGFTLDLSHIAGFIAVIGTGVDDLIIIADEVMAEGSVASGRVFRNRFRKAFWIIGAAAITTVIAMSPLAYLQLGDLRGFAIVTILGVFVGVLITRPAYGDILRYLTTGQ